MSTSALEEEELMKQSRLSFMIHVPSARRTRRVA